MTCGKNDEQFRAVIPGGFEFYRSIGTKSMKIAAFPLRSGMSIIRSRRSIGSIFQKEGRVYAGITIDFDVFYFLKAIEGVPKIFAYITGDEQKFYKEKGLVPD